jgi:putative nucleotidyltransferase-like protein
VSPPGRLIAAVLNGAWRESPGSDAPLSAADLDQITPLIYNSGAAGLAWWRLRRTTLCESPSAELLHQAFRLQALFAKTHENKVQKSFRLFRAAGVEPILIKGWAVGRLYPEAGLRPSGDIDLFVKRQDVAPARQILSSEAAGDCWVDLHARIFELGDREPDDLFARSELYQCGDEKVRVLCPEHHFALLAVHLLKHGAWRPLWLCDLGLLLESMPESFDWNLCLGENKRRKNWILAAVSLAHSLLGARIPDEGIIAGAERIPSWVAGRVLKEWETPFSINQPPMNHRAPMRSYLRRPSGMLSDLVRRWPNPILATVSANGRFSRLPRITYQLGDVATRTMKFLSGMPHRSTLEQDD